MQLWCELVLFVLYVKVLRAEISSDNKEELEKIQSNSLDSCVLYDVDSYPASKKLLRLAKEAKSAIDEWYKSPDESVILKDIPVIQTFKEWMEVLRVDLIRVVPSCKPSAIGTEIFRRAIIETVPLPSFPPKKMDRSVCVLGSNLQIIDILYHLFQYSQDLTDTTIKGQQLSSITEDMFYTCFPRLRKCRRESNTFDMISSMRSGAIGRKFMYTMANLPSIPHSDITRKTVEDSTPIDQSTCQHDGEPIGPPTFAKLVKLFEDKNCYKRVDYEAFDLFRTADDNSFAAVLRVKIAADPKDQREELLSLRFMDVEKCTTFQELESFEYMKCDVYLHTMAYFVRQAFKDHVTNTIYADLNPGARFTGDVNYIVNVMLVRQVETCDMTMLLRFISILHKLYDSSEITSAHEFAVRYLTGTLLPVLYNTKMHRARRSGYAEDLVAKHKNADTLPRKIEESLSRKGKDEIFGKSINKASISLQNSKLDNNNMVAQSLQEQFKTTKTINGEEKPTDEIQSIKDDNDDGEEKPASKSYQASIEDSPTKAFENAKTDEHKGGKKPKNRARKSKVYHDNRSKQAPISVTVSSGNHGKGQINPAKIVQKVKSENHLYEREKPTNTVQNAKGDNGNRPKTLEPLKISKEAPTRNRGKEEINPAKTDQKVRNDDHLYGREKPTIAAQFVKGDNDNRPKILVGSFISSKDTPNRSGGSKENSQYHPPNNYSQNLGAHGTRTNTFPYLKRPATNQHSREHIAKTKNVVFPYGVV